MRSRPKSFHAFAVGVGARGLRTWLFFGLLPDSDPTSFVNRRAGVPACVASCCLPRISTYFASRLVRIITIQPSYLVSHIICQVSGKHLNSRILVSTIGLFLSVFPTYIHNNPFFCLLLVSATAPCVSCKPSC